jgi:ribosomal-protein-serine acetyltransferase
MSRQPTSLPVRTTVSKLQVYSSVHPTLCATRRRSAPPTRLQRDTVPCPPPLTLSVNRPLSATMLSAGLFIFRPFNENDAPSFAEAVRESGATVGKWMSWAHADYAESDALTWFELCARDRANGTSHEFGIFDAESQTLVGGCGLNQFNLANGFCNLGYWVRQSWQRRGAALAAIQALSRYAFDELQQGRVEIVVAAGNTPSFALAAKAGALHECLARNRLKLHGQFTDAHVFSLVPGPRA